MNGIAVSGGFSACVTPTGPQKRPERLQVAPRFPTRGAAP